MGIDGNGIRTLVLLMGCPLKCKYCVNPFSWGNPEEAEMMTAEEVYSKICIDRPYLLATNGGITFGGGEPLLYPGLINEIRGICEPEMTINLETALHVPWDNVESVVETIDTYYVDIKTLEPQIYKGYTGQELEPALENLKKLIEIAPKDSVIVRVPQIPGFVDKAKQLETKRKLAEIGVTKFDLFKYTVIK
jgi:pyruvate formate lyase activating enzyme